MSGFVLGNIQNKQKNPYPRGSHVLDRNWMFCSDPILFSSPISIFLRFFFFFLEDSSVVSSKSFIKVFASATVSSISKGSLLFHEFISLFISLRMFLTALFFMFSLA